MCCHDLLITYFFIVITLILDISSPNSHFKNKLWLVVFHVTYRQTLFVCTGFVLQKSCIVLIHKYLHVIM